MGGEKMMGKAWRRGEREKRMRGETRTRKKNRRGEKGNGPNEVAPSAQ